MLATGLIPRLPPSPLPLCEVTVRQGQQLPSSLLQLVLDRLAISTDTTISCILPVQTLLQLAAEQHPSQGPGETQME